MIRQYGYRIEKVEGNIATIVFPDFIKYGTSSIKLNIKKNDVLNEMVYLLTEFVAECLKEFCPKIPSDNYRERELCPIIIAVQAADGKMYPTGYHEKIYTQVFPVDFSKTSIIDFHLFGTSFVDFYDEGIENSVTFTYEQKANKNIINILHNDNKYPTTVRFDKKYSGRNIFGKITVEKDFVYHTIKHVVRFIEQKDKNKFDITIDTYLHFMSICG